MPGSPWALSTFPEATSPGRCSEKPPAPEGGPRPEDIPAGPDPPDRRGVGSDPRGKRPEEEPPRGPGPDPGPPSLSTLPVNEWTLAKIRNLISLFDDCARLADGGRTGGAGGAGGPFWDAELPDAGDLGGRIEALLSFWSAGVAVGPQTVIFSEVRSGGFERVTRGGDPPPLECGRGRSGASARGPGGQEGEPRQAAASFCELLGEGGRRESLRWISAAGRGEGPEDSCCLFRLIELRTGSPLSPGCRCPSAAHPPETSSEERAGRFPARSTQAAAREDLLVGTSLAPTPRSALPGRTPESAALSSGPGREDRRAPPRPPVFGKSPAFPGGGDQAPGTGSEPGGKRGVPRRVPPAAEGRGRRIGDDPPAGGFRGGIGFEPGSAKRKRDIGGGDPRSEFPRLHPRLPCPAPVPEQAKEEGGRSSRQNPLPDPDLDVSGRRRRKRRRRAGPASPVICGSISSTPADWLPGFARLNADLSRKQGAPPGPELHACAEELGRAGKAPAPEEHMVPRGSEGLEEIRRQGTVGGTGSPKAQRAWEGGAGRRGPTGMTPLGLLGLERAGSWGAPRRREPGRGRPTPGPRGAPARSMFERGNPALAAEPRGGGLLQFKLWPGAGDLPGAAREAERGPAPDQGGPGPRAAGERAGAPRTRPWKVRGAWSQGSEGRAPAGPRPPAEPTPPLAPGARTAADAVFQEYRRRFLQKELKSSEKPVPGQAERTGSVG
ncbi:collagen alpha-1(I) chain-like [Lepisosteus oculatus]|uniref:collagen alpha-1(I) chain-like n=1 Tax=Lepisosteus oculatus TaxID=7918 RepID=UPI00371BAEDE